ncbi:MAG: hypothetical protein IH973_06915 [Myxococcales bacterium]|nr:hypothetical protein [Myxococcales bacterium]
MKFLISMADVEDEWDTLSAEEQGRIGHLHGEFQRDLGDRFVCYYGIRPSAEAKTIRLHEDDRVTISDGLATPTKEPAGGFYIIESESMQEAIGWARRGRFRPGPNEVRQLRDA